MQKKYLYIIALLILIAFQFPAGRLALYPFTILGTWFHEMGHGLAALLLGGSFEKLEMFSDGSGIATWSGDLYLGAWARGLVALAGPIGPALVGYALLRCASTPKAANTALYVMTVMLIVSALIWVRSVFGFVIIIGFGVLLGFAATGKNEKIKIPIVISLGLLAFVSVYQSIGYLMSEGGVIAGNGFASDTAVAAGSLLLPFWFWGAAVIILSLFLLYDAVKRLK